MVTSSSASNASCRCRMREVTRSLPYATRVTEDRGEFRIAREVSSKCQTGLTAGRKPVCTGAVILSAVAFVLAAFSFHGALDEFARKEVIETTNESVGIYVISRGINALVSVLQTSEINLPLVASMQVGEMLDPVNDAVERLSSIVVWAIGSLFLQRILLEVASSPAFKWILFSICITTIATLLLMEWDRFRALCGEVFAVSNARQERCKGLVRTGIRPRRHLPLYRPVVPRRQFLGQSTLP